MADKVGGYISEITFNNGEKVEINKNDIVIFVGPNNAGKSQSLKDIYALSEEPTQTTVITDINIEKYQPILTPFLDSLDTPKIGSDYKALRIYMGVICLFGIQIACQQTFVSLGNAPVSLFLAILRKIILLIPLIYIVPLFMEDKCSAIFLAEPIADFIAVSTTATIFIIVFKKSMKKIS